jgi:cell wall-associated NlpC family hydrolase
MTALERQRVLLAASSWLGTPYHHAGRVKGAGVDCLTLLAEVYHEAGLVEKVKIPYYPMDWHLHRDAERYMEGLLSYTRELEVTATPQPGDIALWKFGRCFSHGAIVMNWPLVIHAYVTKTVCYENVEQAAWLNHIGENVEDRGKLRPRKFFSLTRWA